MLRFLSFGSGSSGNCYYLHTGTEGLLIDTGVGVRILKKDFADFGLDFSEVRNIIITHDHADHVKCVGVISNENNIPVYATKKVHEGIMRNYCVRKKINNANIRYIEKGVTFELGSYKVTPFEVPHDSNDNVGFKIECEGVVFCIMTDIGHVTEQMQGYINEANYLVIEANHDEEMLLNGNYPTYLKNRVHSDVGHLSNKNCGLAIAEHASPKLKHVWLCHLSQENNHPELARKTVEMILNSYGIVPGRDFYLDVLKRKYPSYIYVLTSNKQNQ